jgi:hypothetical protein
MCLVNATNHFLDVAIDSMNANALMRTLHTRPYYRGLEKEALIFLIHFLGDVHQPMHCETGKLDDGSSDRNATLIHVTFNGGHMPGNESGDPNNDNLHFVWDVSLIEWEKLDEQTFVDHLITDILRGGDRSIGVTTEVANNSHEYARFEGVMVKDHTDLNAAYMDAQNYMRGSIAMSSILRSTANGRGSAGSRISCSSRGQHAGLRRSDEAGQVLPVIQ